MKQFADTAFAPIPKTPPKTTSGTGRGRTASTSSVSGKWKPLTNEEAITLRPKLVQYLEWQSEHADNLIIATVKGHDPTIEIWGNMDDAEIEILADYLIMRGRHDARTAQAIRFASEILDRIKVAIIVLPRVYRTVNLYLARGFDVKIFISPPR